MSEPQEPTSARSLVNRAAVMGWTLEYVCIFLLFFIPLKMLGFWAFAFPPWLLTLPVYAFGMSITEALGLDDEATFVVIPTLWTLMVALIAIAGYRQKSHLMVAVAGYVFVPLIGVVTAFFAAGLLGDGLPTSG